MAHIEIHRPDDETVVILVGGVEVARANHDEHGYSGMNIAVEVALGIGRELHTDVEDI